MSHKKLSAFTLTELMVVICVIAIISAIVYVSYGGVTRRATEASIKSSLSTLGRLIDVDETRDGSYPATASDINFGSGIGSSDLMTYQYFSSSDYYCLSATSKDGKSVYKISSASSIVQSGGCSGSDNWKQISAGFTFTCGLTYDGRIFCWGYNGAQQIGSGNVNDYVFAPEEVLQGEMPAGAVKSISAGYGAVCAIASDDNAYCWGWNGEGEVGNNSTDQIVAVPTRVANGARPDGIAKAISVGDGHVCAIGSDDSTYCWGTNSMGDLGISTATTQSLVPVKVSQGAMPSLSVKSISSGDHTTCAIASDDKAYCWGWNGYGELGNGTDVDSYLPVAVSRGEMTAAMTVKAVSVGKVNSCAIDTNNALFCWGQNWNGQLGNDTWDDSYTPVAVSIGAVRNVTVGENAVCALTINGDAKCWGYNNEGALGSGSVLIYNDINSPISIDNGAIPAESKLSSISMYYDHTCAIDSDGKGYCWGSGWEGQLGSGKTQDDYEINSPIAIGQGEMPNNTVKAIFGGDARTCVWASDSKLYCWGNQIYRPSVYSYGLPGTGTVKMVAVSDEHFCVIASDDAVYCYGYNNHGQLGNGTTTDNYDYLKKVSQGALPAGAIKSISASNYQTCAIASDDKPYCWGDNGSSDILTPTLLARGAMPTSTVKALSSGHDFTCAISMSNSRPYCLGFNGDGQLGDGSYTNRTTFVAVSQGAMPTTTVKSLVPNMDAWHMCAIGSDDNAYCWGNGAYGQLGNGILSSTSVPVKAIMPAGAVKLIKVYEYNTCAISYDDKPYCWGANNLGSLGNGDTNLQSYPVNVLQGEIPSPFTVKSLGMGYNTACVVAWNDKAYCWGRNYYGELGVFQNSRFANAIPNLITSTN